MSRQRLADSHTEDKARGLADDHIKLINIHFTTSMLRSFFGGGGAASIQLTLQPSPAGWSTGIFDLAKNCKFRQR